MKNFKYILPAALLAFASCSPTTRNTEENVAKTDVVADTAVTAESSDDLLPAKMSIKDTIKTGESILLKLTVYNHTDSLHQFLKWHTPFEPWISKYLDIKDENGVEVNYKGAMAKRIMPPPADSYLKIAAKDSVAAEADLLKGYAITHPGKYTIVYNSQNVSGLNVKDSVTFVYSK